MIDLSLVLACAAVPIMLLVGRGLVPFLIHKDTSVELKHFSRGLFMALTAACLSTLYWDAAMPVFRAVAPETWEAWSEAVGGSEGPNALRNLLLIAGGVEILRAFQQMIPERERPGWSIWSAPFYPRGWWSWKLTLLMMRSWRRK